MTLIRIGTIAMAFVVGVVSPANAEVINARVVDAATRQPIVGAIVVLDRQEAVTDASGAFCLTLPTTGVIRVRAYGFSRAALTVEALRTAPEIALSRFRPRALYLSVYGIGSRALREPAVALVDRTELNALVIDIKGDRGLVGYRSTIPLVARVGAQTVITMPDLPALVRTLHQKGIYAIGRIVVFKDDPLATSRPDLAIHRRGGSTYRDRENLSWTNPHSPEVRRYNIELAIEAAKAGFDEIQCDYVRFPDTKGLDYAVPDTEASRVSAILDFLREAKEALRPYGVFLSIDIFGYVCWNTNDTGIGQRLEQIAQVVDYISPMLYPSSFQFGIPGFRNPVKHPYEIVRLSLERAIARTKLPSTRFRPWLQAFADYAFGYGAYTSAEVRAQVSAADSVGTNGWMLWNPRNRYSAFDTIEAGQPEQGMK